MIPHIPSKNKKKVKLLIRQPQKEKEMRIEVNPQTTRETTRHLAQLFDTYVAKSEAKSSYLLGLLAKIKCSICSYQLNL